MRLITLFLLLLCWGCNSSAPSTSHFFEKNGKIKVLSTTAIIDDMVGRVGGEYIDHIPLIYGEIDPHSYELVKGDDEKLHFAELIVGNGLNLEHGASLRAQLYNHKNVLLLGEEIKKQHPESILYVGNDVDPHIWMDVRLWSSSIDSLVEALSQLDPDHAADYRKNGQALYEEMANVDRDIYKELQAVPADVRYLVTSHDAFNYFARAYLIENGEWKERFIAPEGLAPEGQLSTQDIQRVVDHLLQYQIRVVFPESNVSRDALKKITSACQHKGLNVKISPGPLYGDAMGSSASYIEMMRHNSSILFREFMDEVRR